MDTILPPDRRPPAARRRGRPIAFNDELKRLFCDLLREGATRRLAAQACGVTRHTAMRAAKSDSAFAQACRKAESDRLSAAVERYAPWRMFDGACNNAAQKPSSNECHDLEIDDATVAAWDSRDRVLMRRWERRLVRKVQRRLRQGKNKIRSSAHAGAKGAKGA
jgi:hypothetical protein